ncbi:uncharacterized protein BO72DRAFT_215531 [Aspergillus fijiensis CBS 313.89]|uniref:Uncharacterized protein n=1 Tax=Aspergillus fijiensis CBS 313.89 TaxID=1448319 RepID=A0A8G1RKJ5_9EURO|nr:uncharacterized protein BO72DRAFT_215531 [Aspergillus fijiensis CBS 313.89]RAK74112.1 hypothetical protein BO72DRAFT_215531 [Aspergillus fijiensis CBS 313.89]
MLHTHTHTHIHIPTYFTHLTYGVFHFPWVHDCSYGVCGGCPLFINPLSFCLFFVYTPNNNNSHRSTWVESRFFFLWFSPTTTLMDGYYIMSFGLFVAHLRSIAVA